MRVEKGSASNISTSFLGAARGGGGGVGGY